MPTVAIAPKRRMPQTENYMTVAEAAGTLGLHPVTVRRLIKADRLKHIKVGYATMVARDSVEAFKVETEGMSKFDPRRAK